MDLVYFTSIPRYLVHWQEVKLHLATEGKLKHIRLFIPASKNATEIDWIEITSKSNSQKKRWDF